MILIMFKISSLIALSNFVLCADGYSYMKYIPLTCSLHYVSPYDINMISKDFKYDIGKGPKIGDFIFCSMYSKLFCASDTKNLINFSSDCLLQIINCKLKLRRKNEFRIKYYGPCKYDTDQKEQRNQYVDIDKIEGGETQTELQKVSPADTTSIAIPTNVETSPDGDGAAEEEEKEEDEE